MRFPLLCEEDGSAVRTICDLCGGDKTSAKRLAGQYKKRMTDAQKKSVSKLFSKYGVNLGW